MVAPSTRGNDASVERPRFRQDLVAEAVEDGGNKFIDVADPDTGNVFRFFEVEFSIACAMDGQRDAAGIRDWAKEELGLMPSLNEVRNVIASLRDLGFIDAGDAAGVAAAAAEPSKPIEAPTRPTPPPPVAQQQAAAPKAAVAKGATLSGPAVSKPASPAQADKDLAAGIVVGAKGASAPAEDVELGRAGASAAAAQAPMPKAADIALGAPGASAAPKPPKIPVEDVALGNAGAKDVSLDLADHVAVGKDDLKEAVRQSKVMTAVEVPKELQDALEDKKPAAAAPVVAKTPEPAKPATPAVATPPAATPPAAKPEPAQQTAKGDQGGKKGKKGKDKSQPVQQVKAPEAAAAKAPEAKKDEPKKAEPAKKDEPKKAEPAKQESKKDEPKKAEPSKQGDKKGNQQAAKNEKKPVAPVPPPEPEKKTSGALIGVLIVVLLAAGAFLVWKYVLNKKSDSGSVSTTAPVKPTTPPPAEKPPTPPPAPPAPKAQIAMTTPMPAPQYSTFRGKLESIIPDGDVKKGDIIARLEGSKKTEPARVKIEKELKKFQDQAVAAMKLRDEARASNDAAADELDKKYEAAMLKVNEQQAALDKHMEEASKLEIMASHDGKLVGVAKVGADIVETTLIANIAQNPKPLVTFKFPEGNGTRYDIGTAQVVMSGSEMVTCNVHESTPEALTLECPQNELTKDGTELTFRAPTTPAN